MRYAVRVSRATTKLVISLLVFVVAIAIVKYHPATKSVQPGFQQNQAVATTAPELQTAECHMNGQLPDASCTPGTPNPDVTQANISQTICKSGYTATIRPPVSYTNKLKLQQMQAYGFSDSLRTHEEDHLISLELGGSPTDPKNLWPEPGNSPNPKDKVENFLHAEVCAGKIPLTDAQTRIAQNWTTAEQGL